MEVAFCGDCKTTTEAMWDHATGDLICTECALVLDSHFIDETAEWRTFNDDSNDNDPIRVGQTTTTDILLGKCHLSTVITAPKGTKAAGDFLLGSLASKQNRVSNSDKALMAGCKTIADMVDRLGLIPNIKYRATEIYKKVQDQKSSRGRNGDAVLAACLHLACQQENKPHSVKEICTAANVATTKEFHRAKKYVVKQLEVEMGHVEIGTVHAGDYLRRFCSNLGMNNQSVKAAEETVQTIDKMDIRRNPTSVAAAVIYILTRLSEEKKPVLLRDVSVATGVAEGTIRNTCRDLKPHLSTIIPSWFAKKVDLSSL